jgi:hypothetical protein
VATTADLAKAQDRRSRRPEAGEDEQPAEHERDRTGPAAYQGDFSKTAFLVMTDAAVGT